MTWKFFYDPYRGNGVFVSIGRWTFAFRRRWHFCFVRPPMKRGYARLYIGPLEIERRAV